MLKKIMLIACFYAGSSLAMQDDKIAMTQETYNKIQKINKDGGVLYYYFKGVFEAMGEKASAQDKPSDILKFLQGNDSSNDKADSMLKYMKTSGYLDVAISKHYDELDRDFAKKYSEIKDVKETWKWFDGHFKQKGLIEPLNSYKFALIKNEKESDLN
jgi:hypothetical protein